MRLDLYRDYCDRSCLLLSKTAADDALVVADGTSCRHQIEFGTARQAVHVVQVLARAIMALETD